MKMSNPLLKHFLLLSTTVMLAAFSTASRVEAATCTYCHQEIVNSGITVEGKPFHVEHFMCANCLKPIGEEDFYKDNGRYFDRNCYENFITDKCKYCIEPIIGKYIIFESEIYHLACFDENIDKKCLVCNESAVGGGFIDIRKNAVCRRHLDDVLDCHSCFSYVSPDLNDGSRRYSDGRVVCSKCLATAVEDDSQALTIMEEVKAKLAGAGLVIDREFKLTFVSIQELSKLSSSYRRDQLGVTRFRKTEMLAGLVSFQDFEIFILSGLPLPQLKAVLAHELMHVWQFANAPNPQDLQLCEGSCQYAAYFVLMDDNSEEGQFFSKFIEQHKDSNYGDGFRFVLEEVNRRGFKPWLEYLKVNKNPPW